MTDIPIAKAGAAPIIVGTGSLTIEEGAVASAATNVIAGRDLRETQTVPAAEVVYAPAPHALLGEADFNRLVDPPARSHQWLPNVRGAWLTALILSAMPLLDAVVHGKPVRIALIPDLSLYGLGITTGMWAILVGVIRLGRNPREETIRRIRKAYQRSTDVAGN